MVLNDTQAPTTPTGLAATPVSGAQINLSWSASSDNIAVSAYKVFRNTVQIATSALTSYNDMGLSAQTTYTYTVAAFDATGNVSSTSTAVTTTTLISNEVVAVIREDCSGYSNCYNSLKDWESNYGGISFGTCTVGSLTCAKKSAVAKIEGSWVDSDTQPVTFNGWNTSTTFYIRIYTSTEARHNGTIGTGYRMEMDYETPITIQENFVSVDGVSFRKGGSNPGEIVLVDYETDANSRIEVKNCYLRGDYSGSISGISVNGGSSNQKRVYLWNNILENFKGSSCHGIKCAFGTVHAYNNTVVNSAIGIRRTAGTLIAKNNLSYNNTTDYMGTFSSSSTHNLSKDQTAPSTNTYFRGATVLFVSTANNFHLVSTDTGAVDMGTDLFPEFSNDIDGHTRSGSWDIGADEYNGGGGGAPAFGLNQIPVETPPLAPFVDPTFKLNEAYAYPNPAYNGSRPTIHIECGIADSVEIRIYDVAGELLHDRRIDGPPVIINNMYAYEYTWDSGGQASGVYVYVVLAKKAGDNPIKIMKKLALIK